MSNTDVPTEEIIKATARRIFFVEGNITATTQEIADAAGISRPLLHYYFRSRDILFNQVFTEAISQFGKKLDDILASDREFREKLEVFIDTFIEHMRETPFMEVFLIKEINCNRTNSSILANHSGVKPGFQIFMKQVQDEINKGTIKGIDPLDFTINLFSLIAYPVLLKPLYMLSFGLSEENIDRVITNRKQMILNLVFN